MCLLGCQNIAQHEGIHLGVTSAYKTFHCQVKCTVVECCRPIRYGGKRFTVEILGIASDCHKSVEVLVSAVLCARFQVISDQPPNTVTKCMY